MKIRLDQVAVINSILFFLLFYPGENKYAFSQALNFNIEINRNPLPKFKPSPYPTRRNILFPPQVSAQGIYIFDPASGVQLYSKNKDLKLAPASTAKLMTALVAFENYPLDKILTVRNYSNEGKIMHLFAGEKMSVENLLYGALVHSANDAAFVLADNYPGGVSKFVEKMNKRAVELGLENTRFENPVGYDSKNQYITARDLAILSNYILKNPTLSHIVGTKSITVADASYSYFHYLKNVNELLGDIPGVAGVKTGFTENAGENLATMVKRDGKEVLFVVLRSKDRFGDTRRLINWVFSEFVWVPIAPIADQQR